MKHTAMTRARKLTTIGDRKVSIERKDWALLVLECHRAGVTLHGYEPAKAATIRVPLPVWKVMLGALEAAVVFSAYAQPDPGLETADGAVYFVLGSIVATKAGDLFEREA